MAKKAASALNLKAPCHKPFMISVAQVVEIVDSLEQAISLIDAILAKGLQEEELQIRPRAGRGVGIVEVPRGILFHDYTYDDKGEVVSANCIIPTNQNHANIQKDMEAFLPGILNQSPRPSGSIWRCWCGPMIPAFPAQPIIWMCVLLNREDGFPARNQTPTTGKPVD